MRTNSLKAALIVAAVALILAVDGAALHDIVGGIEPDFSAEYAFLAASAPLLVLLVPRTRRLIGGAARR